MIRFEHKEYIILLAGLALLTLAFLLLLSWKKRVKKRIGDEKLVNALIKNFSSRKFLVKFIILGLAFIAGVIAVMNPRKPGAGDTQNRKGIDVAIALDVSKSMLAADLPPNRLERAKQFLLKRSSMCNNQ